MPYTLQAIISQKSVEEKAGSFGLKVVKLPCGLYLIPLPHDYLEKNHAPFLPLTDVGEDDIGERLLEICLAFSQQGKAAYLEAEFFGGQGAQASMLMECGKVFSPARTSEQAINFALRWLGVKSSVTKDEFDVAGLGAHRHSEDWLKNT